MIWSDVHNGDYDDESLMAIVYSSSVSSSSTMKDVVESYWKELNALGFPGDLGQFLIYYFDEDDD